MTGLTIHAPEDTARRAALARMLHDYDLPLSSFADAPSPAGPEPMPLPAFLRMASAALLLGEPLPIRPLEEFLPATPLVANVLRRHLFLRWSLTPYLRPGREVTRENGCILVGRDLIILPVSPEDTVEALLPPGLWTELSGPRHRGPVRCMRGYNETPILARENALLPISMNGQSLAQTAGSDADRLTLHWFQPGENAECVLADGTRYEARRVGAGFSIQTNTDKAFHFIVHEDGVERLVQ